MLVRVLSVQIGFFERSSFSNGSLEAFPLSTKSIVQLRCRRRPRSRPHACACKLEECQLLLSVRLRLELGDVNIYFRGFLFLSLVRSLSLSFASCSVETLSPWESQSIHRFVSGIVRFWNDTFVKVEMRSHQPHIGVLCCRLIVLGKYWVSYEKSTSINWNASRLG